MLMKKLIFLFVIFLAAAALWAQTLYVSVKTVDLKASSGFFAGVLGTLALGDTVTVQQTQGKWLVVRSASGLQGWAPADAFSARRSFQSGSGVSATEFALAGKGFNNDLEKILLSTDKPTDKIDYSKVDAMERRILSQEEIRSFLREGRLAGGE